MRPVFQPSVGGRAACPVHQGALALPRCLCAASSQPVLERRPSQPLPSAADWRRSRLAAASRAQLSPRCTPPGPLHSPRCRALQSSSGIVVGGATPQTVDQILPLPRTGSSLPARALFGSLLGLAGALIILTGGWAYTAAISLIVYQVCQEFQGFLTSKGISEGMQPPPPLVSALSSLLCVCFTIWTHVSNGKSTAALAVTSFAVLSLQMLAVDKPHFSQLTSSVFGLFYCGQYPLLIGVSAKPMQAQ